MMYSDGAIIAQIQDIVNDEMRILFNGYLAIEKGTYFSFHFATGFKEQEQEIQMRCDAAIHVNCGILMKAVRQYKTCPMCGGMGSYAGYGTYEWCLECNCFQEVPA